MQKLLLILLLFISGVSVAQTDTSYHMLWFKGKKLKPNVLLKPTGDTVYYYPDNNLVKLANRKNAPGKLDLMRKEVENTKKRTIEMYNAFAQKTPKIALPWLRQQIESAFTSVEGQYIPLVQNTFQLPDSGIVLPQSMKAKGADWDNTRLIEDEFLKAYGLMGEYRQKHVNDSLGILPVPPRYNFTYCSPCDSLGEQSYQKQLDRFMSELYGSDAKMMEFVMAVCGQGQKNLTGEAFERSVAEFGTMHKYLLERMNTRVRILFERYKNDPYRLRSVFEVTLRLERYNALLTGKGIIDNFMEISQRTIINHLIRAGEERDYAVALNMQLFMQTERVLQLLASPSSPEVYEKFFAFNQFKMNMNISAKVGKEGKGYILGHIKSDNYFFAIPDSSCNLRWVLINETPDKMKHELVTAEFKSPGPEILYTGTKQWESGVPDINVEFCRPDTEEEDSIVAYPFNARNGDELWSYPQPLGVMRSANVSGMLLSSFIDIDRVKRELAQVNDKEKIEQMKKEMLEHQKALQGNAPNVVGSGGTVGFNEVSYLGKIQEMTKAVTEKIFTANPGKYIFKPVVHNRQEEILKERLNGREIFPENEAIIYAFFHLTLNHTTDGPYKFVFSPVGSTFTRSVNEKGQNTKNAAQK